MPGTVHIHSVHTPVAGIVEVEHGPEHGACAGEVKPWAGEEVPRPFQEWQ